MCPELRRKQMVPTITRAEFYEPIVLQTLTRRAAIFCLALLATACENGGSEGWRDLGRVPAPSSTTLNHTPMVVIDDRVLVGSSDGVWARPLDGAGEWTEAGLQGTAIFATRRHPTLDATIFAAGQPVNDARAAPFYRSDDGGHTWVASSLWPRNPFDQATEPFFDLAIAPDDPDRLYANLSGPSIAVSTDGGLTWTLANGETEVFFGDPCVVHVLASDPRALYQGCEAPLDNAWVATYRIDPADPLLLADFTFVAGGPDFALENRRPNSLGSGPARPDTLYAGLEGALIALDASGFEFLFRAEDDGDSPYAYIKGIWLDPADPDRLIFGGGVNGQNEGLSLFETRDHGRSIRRLRPPRALDDPAIEQLVPAGDAGIAALISERASSDADARSLSLFVLD